jgi:hypothetical protein
MHTMGLSYIYIMVEDNGKMKYIMLKSRLESYFFITTLLTQSDQTKDYKIGICCFSAKYAALRRKSEDWLARN